jgi:nucleoside-diphosphate-sugar epimerase
MVKSSLIQRRVLVTGAAGCIGAHLTRRLAGSGYIVTALVRSATTAGHLAGLSGVELREGDITDPRQIDQLLPGVDQVFHLAACVHAPPDTPESRFFQVNLEGTRHLVEAAIRHRVRAFIHFSTVAVHAETDATIDEDGPIAPSTPYARSKYASEQLVLSQGSAAARTRVAVLRLPVVYGRGDRGNVSHLIDAIRRHRYLVIGDGQNRKSMLAVGNAVDAAILAAEDDRSRGRTYIVTDARPYSQQEIATTIAELLGYRRRLLHLPLPAAMLAGTMADLLGAVTGRTFPLSLDRVRKLARNTCYSGERIRHELGFTPRLDLREGLREILGRPDGPHTRSLI